MSLNINYNAVERKVKEIRNGLANSDILADYTILSSNFAESEGKEADAIRTMLINEKEMARQLNRTLKQFANGIQSAVNEFKKLDQNTKKAMKSGGAGSKASKSGRS